jgi:hypothetical protein
MFSRRDPAVVGALKASSPGGQSLGTSCNGIVVKLYL